MDVDGARITSDNGGELQLLLGAGSTGIIAFVSRAEVARLLFARPAARARRRGAAA